MTEGQAMQGNSTSSVLGRRLGGELYRFRTAAGLTQPQAAKALGASTAKVTKMERGWVPIRDPDLTALCALYRVRDRSVVDGLLELARIDRERRRAKGWWGEFSWRGSMREYVSLESAAQVIRTWQLSYVPGLLQTPAYVRTLNADEQFVMARINRQRRLTSTPPLVLHTVIFEAALRNRVGGAAVMRDQLAHLATMAGRPGVSVRVLPFRAGAHSCMDSAFNVLSFAERGSMDVAYMEGPFAQLWVEGGDGAAQHAELFGTLARQALSERESEAFIHTIREEL